MNRVFNLVWLLARTYFINKTFDRLKRKSVLAYLRTLQVVRRTLCGMIAIFCFLQLMVIGFVGTVVTAVMLLPQENETKLWILFGISLAFFLIPLAIVSIVFSEKIWFQLSGASELVNQNLHSSGDEK